MWRWIQTTLILKLIWQYILTNKSNNVKGSQLTDKVQTYKRQSIYTNTYKVCLFIIVNLQKLVIYINHTTSNQRLRQIESCIPWTRHEKIWHISSSHNTVFLGMVFMGNRYLLYMRPNEACCKYIDWTNT